MECYELVLAMFTECKLQGDTTVAKYLVAVAKQADQLYSRQSEVVGKEPQKGIPF